MRQLYYTIQTLIRGRGSNIIKIVSLTLGILVSILLFARVAFESSYEDYCHEPEKLYLTYFTRSETGSSPYVFGTLAAAFRENFPNEVVSATVFRELGDIFYANDKYISKKAICADSCFFATMGVDVIAGRVQELGMPYQVFVSRSFARQLAGSEETAIGMVIDYQRKYPMTIRGVFEDIPENTTFPYDVVCSFSTLWEMFGKDRGRSWGADISYITPVRFRHPADVAIVEARVPDMMKKYMPDFDKSALRVVFQPIRHLHASDKTVHTMVVVMSILGAVILLIAAMNYVLISVSSIDRRAKAIGVHKCNGAETSTIFGMFLTETAVIILLSIVFAVMLMVGFREIIADVLGVSLRGLFTFHTLWVPVSLVCLLFLLAGLLPAWMFSSIPVTQVFHRYTEGKVGWKRVLLFIQFTGTTLVFGFLVVVISQYHLVMNKELAYNPDRVVDGYLRFGELDNARMLFVNMPMVERYGGASQSLTRGTSGDRVNNANGDRFNIRFGWISNDFVPLLDIQIVKGRNVQVDDEVLVNEEFIRQKCWTDDPIGKQIMSGDYQYGIVVGVMKDFPVKSAYHPLDPLVLIGKQESNYHFLRLKEPFQENLEKLNRQLKEMFPATHVEFSSMRVELNDRYSGVRAFRDGVVIAFAAILLITLMGLIGYTNDEVRRRSKEIAIRKVNGAEASDILSMMAGNVVWIALPAVLVGVVASYFTGQKWLEQFADQIEFSSLIYIGIGIAILVLIIGCVLLRAWQIANENPVLSIKSE